MDEHETYYQLRSDSIEAVASRFHLKAGRYLNERKWRAAFDQSGRLDISKVLIRIQKGGVHPLIRGEVWEFLLGCFHPDSSYAERAAIRKLRRQQYFNMKAECQAMDSAVGSGMVITLPRINEDGSSVKQHSKSSEERLPNFNNLVEQSEGTSVVSDVSILEDHYVNGYDETSDPIYSKSRPPAIHKEECNELLISSILARDVDSNRHETQTSYQFTNGPDAELHPGVRNRVGTAVSQGGRRDFGSRISNESQTGKLQAATMPVVDEKVLQWRLVLHQVGLDVVRTDRSLQFYEKPEHLAKLADVLAVYAWMDPDIGYCQGMSDLCSPMVVIFENEADAFWCFERLMNRLRENFRCTEQTVGVQKQLENLGSILSVIDPKLHRHLDEIGGSSYIFAFRMMMVLFRREFSFADSLYLWEMMWALEYNPHFIIAPFQEPSLPGHAGRGRWRHELKGVWTGKREKALYRLGKFQRQIVKYRLSDAHEMPFLVFCAAGIFEAQRQRLQEAPGLDDVVKILNDVTGKLDAKKACKEALKIHKNYLLKGKKTQ